MKKHFLIVILLAVLACNKSSETNVELLSKREMVDILIDIHILEAKVIKLRLKTDSAKAVYNSLEEELFKSHEVEKDIYEKSYQYYLVNTKEMQSIYNVVVDSLNLRHQRTTVKNESAGASKAAGTKKSERVPQRKPDVKVDAKPLQVKPLRIDSVKVK